MADVLRQHYSFIDLHNSQQVFPLPDTISSRTFPKQQMHGPQREAMAQPAMQRHLRPEHDIRNQVWPSQRMIPRGPEHPQASTAGAFTGITAPIQRSMWDHDAVVDNAFAWTTGLPMEPFIMQEDARLGPNSHLSYNDGLVTRQNVVGKNGTYGYEAGPSWTLSATGSLRRQVSVFNGSEFDTNASSLSPRSFFSEPSDLGQLLGNEDMKDQVAPSNSWVGFNPASASNTKHSQSPSHNQSTVLSFDSHPDQQVGTSTDVGSTLHRTDLDIVPSVEQSPTSISWPSDYPNQPMSFPYYPRDIVPTGSFQQSKIGLPSAYPAYAPSDASYHSYGSEARCDGPIQDNFRVGRAAESHAQRKAEDHMLIEGKAKGLTYKEIRKTIGTNVAESTLRGRYRSLMKPRKDRVRKPVWKEKDLQLLEEVVTSELDRLDDGCRVLNEGQRLAKISWKKVAEYIAEHGGSYHFGNSTCKKKWTELEGR